MGTREYWNRMLVYFGIAEGEDDEPRSREPRGSRRGRPAVDVDESWDDDEPVTPAPRRRAGSGGRRMQAVAGAGGVGVVPPKSFNDAQAIADQFKRGRPVIVNLQGTDSDLAKRVIDFASGLTYGLDGSMQRIADKVFLLTPEDVDVTAEDRAAMLESGFFNQS